LIIDNFLNDFKEFRDHVSGLDYKGTVNPLDGVIYPNINIEIPDSIKYEVLHKISDILNKKIQLTIPLCLRLSLEGVKAPHQAHTDSMMGEYNFILYMNDGSEGFGTSIVKHVSGMEFNPKTIEEEQLWIQDTNNYNKWEIIQHYQMKSNRAVIIPSHLFHRAEPVHGFGTSALDGRLVLLAFFNVL